MSEKEGLLMKQSIWIGDCLRKSHTYGAHISEIIKKHPVRQSLRSIYSLNVAGSLTLWPVLRRSMCHARQQRDTLQK